MATNFSTRQNTGFGLVPPDFTKIPVPTQINLGPYAAAAGSITGNYSGLAGKRPKPGAIYGLQNELDAREQIENWGIEASTKGAFLKAYGDVVGAQKMAEAQAEAAGKRAGASKEAGMWGGIGKIVSAGLPLLMACDERTKHSIERLDDVTLMLRELNPVSFYYKDEFTSEPSRMHYGFIAQEYKDVMPDATYVDSESGMYRIDINQLIALLVRGYQQLDNRVTRMEAKNALAGALK